MQLLGVQLGVDLPHPSQNRIEVQGLLFCLICINARKNGRIKKKGVNGKFSNCRALHSHLVIIHNHQDKDERPTRDQCLELLQTVSDTIVLGIWK